MGWLEENKWRQRAACRPPSDTDIFFPGVGEHDKEIAAKSICAICPVTKECLEYALMQHFDTAGIWGGTTHRERKRMSSRIKILRKSLRT